MLRAALAIALLVGVVSCGTDDPPLDTSAACVEQPLPTGAVEGAVNCRLDARLAIEVSGAVELKRTVATSLAINEFWKGKLPEAAWFANLGMGVPADHGERTKFRAGFDIAPGTYRGPGTYEFTGERPTVEGLSSPLESAAFLEITSLDPADIGLVIYGEMVQPCRLRVIDRLTRGRLSCPELAADDGRTVSLRMSWAPAA